MPKISSEKQYNSFIKGLITEANPLTFPENASLDEDNFVLLRNGSRIRRQGIDYEDNYSITNTGIDITKARKSFHVWSFNRSGTSFVFGVIRIGSYLYFIDLLTPNPSANFKGLAGGAIGPGINLFLTDETKEIEVATINNTLVIVSEALDKPIALTYYTNYLGTPDKVVGEPIEIKIRDFFGVYDTESLDPPGSRSPSITEQHIYNLLNQGWSDAINTPSGLNAIDYTKVDIGVYPNNYDVWTYGKITSPTDSNFENYSGSVLAKNSFDLTEAPKGHFIIDAFKRGTSRIALAITEAHSSSPLAGLLLDKEYGRLSTIASYAGRVFYSGVFSRVEGADSRTPNYNGYVFFSQIASSNEKLGKCYQDADPTSPHISDIVATDGGTIHIPEATQIMRLISSQSSLLVIAENGIWEIYGDTGGFVATSYQVSKVSSVGCINKNTIVEANGLIFYWSNSGISVLTREQSSGRYVSQSLSINTIQSFYNDIPSTAKRFAKGFFEETENRVRWMYNDTFSYDGYSNIDRYNRELILDITLQSFYLHSISPLATNSPYIADYIKIPSYVSSEVLENLYTGSEQVLVGTEPVVYTVHYLTERDSKFSFLTLRGNSFTISKYTSSSFKDWIQADGIGVNYSSYLVTGYDLFGDMMRKKQTPYIIFFFERTEDGFYLQDDELHVKHPSGCIVQSQWNWTNSSRNGKWGREFQAYRYLRNYIPSGIADTFDSGDRVIITKNKLRGMGKALSLKIQSEEGKDMKLLGWGIEITGGSKI